MEVINCWPLSFCVCVCVFSVSIPCVCFAVCVCACARVCVYSFSSDPRGREETDLTRHIITRRERVMTVGLPWRLVP